MNTRVEKLRPYLWVLLSGLFFLACLAVQFFIVRNAESQKVMGEMDYSDSFAGLACMGALILLFSSGMAIRGGKNWFVLFFVVIALMSLGMSSFIRSNRLFMRNQVAFFAGDDGNLKVRFFKNENPSRKEPAPIAAYALKPFDAIGGVEPMDITWNLWINAEPVINENSFYKLPNDTPLDGLVQGQYDQLITRIKEEGGAVAREQDPAKQYQLIQRLPEKIKALQVAVWRIQSVSVRYEYEPE